MEENKQTPEQTPKEHIEALVAEVYSGYTGLAAFEIAKQAVSELISLREHLDEIEKEKARLFEQLTGVPNPHYATAREQTIVGAFAIMRNKTESELSRLKHELDELKEENERLRVEHKAEMINFVRAADVDDKYLQSQVSELREALKKNVDSLRFAEKELLEDYQDNTMSESELEDKDFSIGYERLSADLAASFAILAKTEPKSENAP